MLKHNSYFEGKVQSVGFERNGRQHTVGVIDIGEFHFDTNGAERMTVVSGEWFTEGFDTRDLKDAQALLAELE